MYFLRNQELVTVEKKEGPDNDGGACVWCVKREGRRRQRSTSENKYRQGHLCDKTFRLKLLKLRFFKTELSGTVFTISFIIQFHQFCDFLMRLLNCNENFFPQSQYTLDYLRISASVSVKDL
uniref:Uncharacterized protein n=1 Tax=Onchocerca volvulus TaxID=6282 RepID=A0A8R1TZZ2_ONCVO